MFQSKHYIIIHDPKSISLVISICEITNKNVWCGQIQVETNEVKKEKKLVTYCRVVAMCYIYIASGSLNTVFDEAT